MSDIVVELDAIQDRFISELRGDPVFGAMMRGRVTREVLIAAYTEIWHCVRETPLALGQTARTIALYASDDPRFSGEQYARFKTPFYAEILAEMSGHSEEEIGHDHWTLSDIVNLGGDPEAVRRSQPRPAMAAYLAVFRHTAVSRTPVGVWGTAYVLEGLGELVDGPMAEALIKHSGIPNIEKAVWGLQGHAEADVGHREAARRRLRIFADHRDRESILRNAQTTAATWGGFGHDVLCRSIPNAA
jgi:pyrroloquinoline quinone (PQQ) biosynthesis protein C